MIILAIDTCGASGSIALGRVGTNLVEILGETELPGKTYSARFIPALRSMLQRQGIAPAELGAIVVVNGPGSFTGIRVGVSSAKGLADALDIPLLAVSRLAVLASKAHASHAALDAGRGEVYFRSGDHESLLKSSDLPATGAEPAAVCESGVQRMFLNAILVEPPTAAEALRFAPPRLLARDFADTETLDGNYVRRSDAEIFAKTAGKA